MTIVTFPAPAYQNLPIETQFYNPNVFTISNITRGQTTVVETSTDHNYVIGQQVRLLVPNRYGTYQINERSGIVFSIPASDEVTLDIDSSFMNAYIASPFQSSITGASKANPCVITSANSFLPGDVVTITGVNGMVELNGHNYQVLSANATSFTIQVDSTGFTTYTSSGTATVFGGILSTSQIMAIGDINSGIISSTGRVISSTNIPGSFINVSP